MYKKRGFTISELLISMAIMASVLTISFNILVPCGKIWLKLDSSVMKTKKISVALRVLNSEFSKCDSSSILFSKSYELNNSQVVSFVSPIDEHGNITSKGMEDGETGFKKHSINSDINWRNVTVIFPKKSKNKSDEFSLYLFRLYPTSDEDNIFNSEERTNFIHEFSIKSSENFNFNRKNIRLIADDIASVYYDSPNLFNGGGISTHISYKTDKGKIKIISSSTEMMNGRK